MSSKICVLILVISLFQAGQTYRFKTPDKINEECVKMMQNVAINYYPQVAIDKYISVMRQQYSKIPEERSEANLEAAVLLIEGALYRTNKKTDQDVRSILENIDDDEYTSDEYVWEHWENMIDHSMSKLIDLFPNEAVEKLANLFTKAKEAETLKEAKEVVFVLQVLALDGARVVTSRLQTMNHEKAM